jgi:predicted GNAT superfamily acetyltransferase
VVVLNELAQNQRFLHIWDMTKQPIGRKKRRKIFRELAAKAYERELDRALSDLESRFVAWREGQVDAFELNEEIHKHHNGISRVLWSRYQLDPEILVPRLVVAGVLKEEEVPVELWEDIKPVIESIRNLHRTLGEPEP